MNHYDERFVPREQMNACSEAGYIVQCAQSRETHVVGYGPLVVFSTASGDAWVLDPEDDLALCLARDGQRLPATILETGEQFTIDWQAQFQLDGRLFVTDRAGVVRTIDGYPVKDIRKIIKRLHRG